MNPDRKHHGATLVEVAVATSLVAVVLVASLETLGGAMRTLREISVQTDAHSLAERMMAEALALPFEDPDGNTAGLGIESDEPKPPTDRLAFDDLDDFENLTRTPPEDRDGTPLADYDGWTQTWRVRYARDQDNGSGVVTVATDDQGLRRVAVVVTSPAGVSTELYAFRSQYGPVDVEAPFDGERATAIGATIVVDDSEAVTRSTVPTNQPEMP